MSIARLQVTIAVLATFLWLVTASQISDDGGVEEGRDNKMKKVKKAVKEAAMMLRIVKDVGQLGVMVVAPLMQLKGLALTAFTTLITFFWFAYELLKTKEPMKFQVLVPQKLLPTTHRDEDKLANTTPSPPTVAILPVVTSHEVHTFDYDYGDNVYNYKQHLNNKRFHIPQTKYRIRR